MTVPFVHRFLDLVVAQDTAAMADMLDPEVVWFGTHGGLDESQVLRGPAAVLEYMLEIQEPWERRPRAQKYINLYTEVAREQTAPRETMAGRCCGSERSRRACRHERPRQAVDRAGGS